MNEAARIKDAVNERFYLKRAINHNPDGSIINIKGRGLGVDLNDSEKMIILSDK